MPFNELEFWYYCCWCWHCGNPKRKNQGNLRNVQLMSWAYLFYMASLTRLTLYALREFPVSSTFNLTVGSCENRISDSILTPFFGGTGSRIFETEPTDSILIPIFWKHFRITLVPSYNHQNWLKAFKNNLNAYKM